MSREVIWTRKRFELVCEQGMLCDLDRQILEEHILRHSNQQIAFDHHCDVSVIDNTIARLKCVYDVVQAEFPDELDKREKSVFRRK